MMPVMCPEMDRALGSSGPGTQRLQLHGELVARRGIVQGEQAAGMADDVDEGAVPERSRRIAFAQNGRIDRRRLRIAPVDGAPGSSLHREFRRPDEAVAVAGVAIVEIDGMDHAVAVHRIGIGDRLEQRIGAVAHIGAAQLRRNPAGDDRQITALDLAPDGQEIAAEIRIVGCPGHIA